jgi:hypothetical protein
MTPSPSPRVVLGALGTLVISAITVLTVFEVVDWSAAQTALLARQRATAEASPRSR